eukprot:TRINITY_DN5109_c0_g1_i2.p1 TRINITY_DN5109_c0_g1~~TRINITY_DN5109_c0_g1_i2.p1  ORF type:complete len:593 (+),score=110.96 TRINITY_DN5109_c0_g1_i2:170-1948(+)
MAEAALSVDEPSEAWKAFLVFLGLCYWGMLAASTVGPGTITLMSRGGAEFGLQLCWTVPLASMIAYCLQEGGARLQILQGVSFGQAMRLHFQPNQPTEAPTVQERELETVGLAYMDPETPRAGAEAVNLPTPPISYAMAAMILTANTFLECAQFAGLVVTVKYYGGDHAALRVFFTLAMCVLVGVILFKGDVDNISKALGVVVVLMTVTFSISAAQTGVSATKLLVGMLPQLPAGSAPQALGMIATTALPFNVFLASTLAEGRSLKECRSGVAFSTAVTAALSLLIIIVGTGIDLSDGESYSLEKLTKQIGAQSGSVSEALFLGGLLAASLSSSLTVAMVAAIACQSLLANPGLVNGEEDLSWASDSWRYRGVIVMQLVLSFCVVGAGFDTVTVIMLSQVVGGVLLPTVAFCLLVCMNSPKLSHMRQARAASSQGRQSKSLNILMAGTCTASCFLAFNAVVPIITGGNLEGPALYVVAFGAAGVMAAASVRVVRSQRREDREVALRCSQRDDQRDRSNSIVRMEQARRAVLERDEVLGDNELVALDHKLNLDGTPRRDDQRDRSSSFARKEQARRAVLELSLIHISEPTRPY